MALYHCYLTTLIFLLLCWIVLHSGSSITIIISDNLLSLCHLCLWQVCNSKHFNLMMFCQDPGSSGGGTVMANSSLKRSQDALQVDAIVSYQTSNILNQELLPSHYQRSVFYLNETNIIVIHLLLYYMEQRLFYVSKILILLT